MDALDGGQSCRWIRWLAASLSLLGAIFGTACATYDPEVRFPLLTTMELRRILGNPHHRTGIQYNRDVGLAFQAAVLAHLPGLKMMLANKKRFESQERSSRGGYLNVIPDGVTGAAEGVSNPLWSKVMTYPESTFIEVKAVHGVLDLAYGRHQLRGMIDALSRSPAASSTGLDRAYPSLYLIVTGDAVVSTELEQFGRQLNVLVWISWVESLGNGLLRVSRPECANCMFVFHGRQTEDMMIPGLPFTLAPLGLKVLDRTLDEPILDDRVVGFPGTPGDTSPNP